MNKSRLWQRPVFQYVLWVSLGVVLSRLFMYVLLDWLTVFLLPLLWLLLLVLATIGIIWAIWAWVRPSGTGQGWRRSLPLVMQLVAIGVAGFVPLERLWLSYNFWRYRSDRQAVVQLFRSGQLGLTSDLVELPAVYQQTSMGGGQVQVVMADSKPYVLFFTVRTIGGAAGFVYSEAAIPPPPDIFSGYQIHQQRQIDSQWYYVRIGD